jgi:transcriptional regulator with XRE-family HTH domain
MCQVLNAEFYAFFWFNLPKIFSKMIATNLRGAFEASGLTVRAIAAKARVKKRTIDDWVGVRKTEPRACDLYAVCKAVCITMEQAVDGEAGMKYVRDYVRKTGGVWEAPEQIADIVADLLLLDDGQLDMIRASAHTAAEKKRGCEKSVLESAG